MLRAAAHGFGVSGSTEFGMWKEVALEAVRGSFGSGFTCLIVSQERWTDNVEDQTWFLNQCNVLSSRNALGERSRREVETLAINRDKDQFMVLGTY